MTKPKTLAARCIEAQLCWEFGANVRECDGVTQFIVDRSNLTYEQVRVSIGLEALHCALTHPNLVFALRALMTARDQLSVREKHTYASAFFEAGDRIEHALYQAGEGGSNV